MVVQPVSQAVKLDCLCIKELLTPQEFRIAGLIREALPNKQIATILGVGEDTVKHHLYAIYDKLGCDNRVQLAVRFQREHPE